MSASIRPFRLAAAVLVGAALLACDDATSTGPPDGTAAVSVLLTDDPGDVAEAWVDVREVYLQGGDAGGRTVLFEGPTGPIDLLTLTDDFQALAMDVEVPAGVYGQLRVVIGGAAVVTEGGETYATEGFAPPGAAGGADGVLQCPSCDTSGFKVLLQGRGLDLVDPNETLIVDFEVGESFLRPAGGSGRWTLQPTLRLFGNPQDAME